MIKYVIHLTLIFLSSFAVAQESSLLSDLDLPLMDGLVENKEAGLLFDSPDGRIINAEAIGSLRANDVNNFYRMVLPSLGWQMNVNKSQCDDGAKYCLFADREQESLTLNVIENSTGLKVLFSLSPN